MDLKALFRKVLFVLGHDIVSRVFACVQIPRQPEKLIAGCGEFLKREIEESLVIGFEDYLTAGSKQFFIYFKEAAIGQPSLVMSLFRPRIGEVQIYPGYRTDRKKFL